MNTLLLLIVGIPIIEIYLFIKIGSEIGAFNTISLIFITAFLGILYARHEGFNTIRSGMNQLLKNEAPIYELISGAALAFAALLLILPGFISDTVGFLFLIPFSRKIIINSWLKNKYKNKSQSSEKIIEAEIVEEDEKKDEL